MPEITKQTSAGWWWLFRARMPIGRLEGGCLPLYRNVGRVYVRQDCPEGGHHRDLFEEQMPTLQLSVAGGRGVAVSLQSLVVGCGRGRASAELHELLREWA